MNNDDRNEFKEIVREVLGKIDEHPKFAVQIANDLSITTGKVNDAILSLRSMGWPVCGDDAYQGYHFGSLAEVENTVNKLKSDRRLMDLAIRFMETSIAQKSCKEASGQEQMHI